MRENRGELLVGRIGKLFGKDAGRGTLPMGNGESEGCRLSVCLSVSLSVLELRNGTEPLSASSLPLSQLLFPLSLLPPAPLLPFDVEESCLPLARLYQEGIRSCSERSAPLL